MRYRDEKAIKRLIAGLLKLRHEKGVGQEDFQNDTGINIGRIESGEGNLTISTIQKICDYYSLPVEDFFAKYYGRI